MKPKRPIQKRTPTPSKAGAPATHDDYLAKLSADQRAALESLRKSIRAAVPEAKECISYGVPAFRLNGRYLLAYGAATNHCAFYPGAVVQALATELKNYDTSKGTLRFPADKPLPRALVTKLVKLRIERIGHRSR